MKETTTDEWWKRLILRRSDLTRSTYGDAKLTPRKGRGAGVTRPYITTYIRAPGMGKQDHPFQFRGSYAPQTLDLH